MGVCNKFDILRQDIQTLPVNCKAICIIAHVKVLTTQKFKINLKDLEKLL